MNASRLANSRRVTADAGCDAALFFSYENRRYLTGFTGSAGWCVVTSDAAVLLTDGRYTEQAQQQAFPGVEVRTVGNLSEATMAICRDVGGASVLCETAAITVDQWLRLEDVAKANDLILQPDQGILSQLRAVKDEQELDLMALAAERAERAAYAVLAKAEPGWIEDVFRRQLESEIYGLGAAAVPFDFIVASGKRSALPHGVASQEEMQATDLVTLDWGAEAGGYFSDQTVSFRFDAYNGGLDEIYDVVYQAQQAALSLVRAGASTRAVDAAARDLIKNHGYGDFFTHGTGHGVGLAIHEYPSINAQTDVELKVGMVITVEPGIYLPDKGGVRLEDTVAVTEQGYRTLTTIDKSVPLLASQELNA